LIDPFIRKPVVVIFVAACVVAVAVGTTGAMEKFVIELLRGACPKVLTALFRSAQSAQNPVTRESSVELTAIVRVV